MCQNKRDQDELEISLSDYPNQMTDWRHKLCACVCVCVFDLVAGQFQNLKCLIRKSKERVYMVYMR